MIKTESKPTSGGLDLESLIPFNYNILNSIKTDISAINDKSLKDQIQIFQDAVITHLHSAYSRGILGKLPSFVSTIKSDGGIIFEISTRFYRIGFDFQSNETETSWYFVTSKEQGHTMLAELMPKSTINEKVNKALSYAYQFS